MIEIKKKSEPCQLLEYRKSEGASYENMPQDVKKVVQDSLMQEQGHLCAYCMRRIRQTEGVPKFSIEHWAAQSHHSDKALDYRNMLAVCSGNRGCGCRNQMTCDARRGNLPLTVNPTKKETLIGIEYNSNGRIFSTNEAVNHDLNDVLNLNSMIYLLPARREVLKILIQKVSKSCSGKDCVQYCKRLSEKLRSQKDEKQEFVGIMLWWLDKRIHRSAR